MILPLYNSLAPLTLTRRVAGAAPFSPADISGLQLWLDATTGLYDATTGGSPVTTDGSAVARWEDQSGNGYHVTQSIVNSQPTLQTAELNSKNVIRFDGSNDFLSSSSNFSITGSSERTIIIVHKRVDATIRYPISWGNSNATGYFCSLSTEYYLRFQATTKGYTNQGANGTWSLVSVIGAGSTLNDYDVYFDGLIATANATNNTGFTLNTQSTPVAIGKNAAISASFANGDTAEILVYDSALSTADREAVEAYLTDKWGL